MNVTTQAPTKKAQEQPILRPWFDLTGLDASAPEWAVAWQALVSAGLANEQGLVLWPTESDGPDCAPVDTLVARTTRLAVVAGALFSRAWSENRPAVAGAVTEVPVDPGTGVEVVLGLLHKDAGLLESLVGQPSHAAVEQMLRQMHSRLVGVYADAPAALAAQIGAVRAQAQQPWPDLVEVMLGEAVADEVFAEHVVIKLAEAGVGSLGFVVVPSGRWVVFRTTSPVATAPGPDSER